jgi:hypothetical protein
VKEADTGPQIVLAVDQSRLGDKLTIDLKCVGELTVDKSRLGELTAK